MSVDWLPHTRERFLPVCRVSNQMNRPRMRVKKAQKTVMKPWSLSQPRFVGRARAGREIRKVMNMNTALTMPAVCTS